ncbi:Uncharacterized protein TPAR_03976 [Tolypocladium paradoxum]|uniref:Nitrogen regulatory protein areA GATA-like domain-containing protein n=1 Tax=Tolypocladium paradoxum TaxID=94208 RepID=A0A2S4L073_9HYPO|nr:Uncharacterized protein TPAR_03976 [Tolypocladium paradoxum]
MESSAPMTLPKGIVINTTNIYKEVASYPTVPADMIWEYWHVYTVTNKKLQDPTARRLENFWWQVWGSDRRFLSGRTLARLYEDISVGPTVVPLQGPPDRWEGPDVPPLTRQMVLAHLNQEQEEQPNLVPPPPPAKPSDASVRSLSSSASKPPPPHPILKKSRGPSALGPRPTARFVSPHESASEGDKDSEFPSSGSTATTGLEMASTASKKKPPAATKKFVAASTAAAKRRPLLPRKTSPHSPILSAVASQDGDLSAGSRTAGLPRPISPIPEGTSNHVGRESHAVEGSISPSPRPSAKALGKRPAVPRRPVTENEAHGKAPGPPAASMGGKTATGRGHAALSRPHALTRNASHPRASSGAAKPTTGIVGSPSIEMAPAMGRSQSHNGYGRPSDRTHARNPSQGLFTGATASTTNVAAQGTIIDQSGSLPTSSVLGTPLNDTFLPGRPSASSFLEPRLTPTQPSLSASVPMGRTRSQLTLLLERDKTRIGDKPRSKG